MIVSILIAGGVILLIALVALAYSANQRKRAAQSGQAEVNVQYRNEGRPPVGRPSGLD